MKPLLDARRMLIKQFLQAVEENKDQILEDASGESYGNALDDIINKGEKIYDLGRIIGSVVDQIEDDMEQAELVDGRYFPCMLQVVAALQRNELVADEILAHLFKIDINIAHTLNGGIVERWRESNDILLKCIGLDLAIWSNSTNDASMLMQDLFGIGGDTALAYIQAARS